MKDTSVVPETKNSMDFEPENEYRTPLAAIKFFIVNIRVVLIIDSIYICNLKRRDRRVSSVNYIFRFKEESVVL